MNAVAFMANGMSYYLQNQLEKAILKITGK